MLASVTSNLVTLNVWKLRLDTREKQLLWSLKNSQGNYWNEGRLSYTENAAHTIILEGIRGTSLGDIALDDIEILPSVTCNVYPINANPGGTTTQATTLFTRTLPLTTSTSTYMWNSQSEFDCNFEVDFCSWTNDTSGDYEWVRVQASSSGYSSGKINEQI